MEILNGQIINADFKDNYYYSTVVIELSLSDGCNVTLGFNNMNNIHNLFKLCGISSYKNIIGSCIRVKIRNHIVKEVGHIIKNEWYENPSLRKLS